MPAFFPYRFTNLESLKRIAPSNLLALLRPFAAYLSSRGLELPQDASGSLDYETLVGILADPDTAMPKQLVDALYLVHEMATPPIMEELLEEAPPGLIIPEDGMDPGPADVAIQILVKDRELLERKHSEQFLIRPKSFVYYQGATGDPREAPVLDDSTRVLVEQELDEWFYEHRRGRGSRVFVHARQSEIWFLVRHGEPIRREGALAEGKPSSVYYRPEKYDVLIYHCELDGLAVNAGTQGQKKLYKRVLGKYLFGNENYFGDGGRYALEPLRQRGEESLDCSGVPGIEWIQLKEIEILEGCGLTVVYKAPTDLFETLGDRAMQILSRGRLVKAGFAIKFTDSKSPRSVNIWQPNRASYVRDADRLRVEEWMREQGFLTIQAEFADDETEPTMVGS